MTWETERREKREERERQTDRQTDRPIYSHTHTHTHTRPRRLDELGIDIDLIQWPLCPLHFAFLFDRSNMLARQKRKIARHRNKRKFLTNSTPIILLFNHFLSPQTRKKKTTRCNRCATSAIIWCHAHVGPPSLHTTKTLYL